MTIARPHILVTGAAGFIGSHLAERLLEHDADLRAVDAGRAELGESLV